MIRFDHLPQFVTITNLNWLPVLQNDLHKQILLEAIKHRVLQQKLTVYAFVIMPNHFHAIWQLHDAVKKDQFQRDLLKFTARSILQFMRMNDDVLLDKLKVTDADREYQVWERNSLSKGIFSQKFFQQKFNYIHHNPITPKWNLAIFPEQYYYSSADFYNSGIDHFGFLTHYNE